MLSQVYTGNIAYKRPQATNWLPRRARFGSSSRPFPPHPWRTTSPRFLLCLVRNRNLRPARYFFFLQPMQLWLIVRLQPKGCGGWLLKLFVKQLIIIRFCITNGKLPPHLTHSILYFTRCWTSSSFRSKFQQSVLTLFPSDFKFLFEFLFDKIMHRDSINIPERAEREKKK